MGIRLFDCSCSGRLEHIILISVLCFILIQFLGKFIFSDLVSFFFFRTLSLKSHCLGLSPVFEYLLIIDSLEVSGLTLIEIIIVSTLHGF